MVDLGPALTGGAFLSAQPLKWIIVISETDIWRIARQLVSDYGTDAPSRAASEAEAALAKGDVGDIEAWKQIIAATRQVLHARSRRPKS